MSAEHTPTPWGVRWTKSSCLITPENDGHGYITKVRFRPTKVNNLEEQSANARHIVKCVNLHDGLVRALKSSRDNLKVARSNGIDNTPIIEYIEQTIARAEEE